MIDALTAALTVVLAELITDIEFQIRSIAGEARAYGLARLVGAGNALLIPASWTELSPKTWKYPRSEDGTDLPLRRVLSSSSTGQEVYLELTPGNSLTLTLYSSEVPGYLSLLETRVLPVDPATWTALETR